MYGDVNVTVQDGILGRSNSTGTGVQVKIGVSNAASDVPIIITSKMRVENIKTLLGYSPLADACMDSIENGAGTIYCIPVAGATAGTVGEIAHNGDGTGTVAISGKPCNAYAVLVQIMESGALNAASMKYSIDGGLTYSEETTIPADGRVNLADTGLQLTFSGESFTEGDIYSVRTTAPVMHNEEVITAVESLKNFNKVFELVHVVGPSTKSLWASLSALADKFQAIYKKPLMFVCESRYINEDETVEGYAQALISDRKGINSIYVQVVAAHGQYVKLDGREETVNLAGVITGLYGASRESQSVGEVGEFPISSSKLLLLRPKGIEEHIKELDEAGYCTIRQYHGLEDYFVTSANMFSPENSYFRYAEETRVLNRIVRDVRIAALEVLQREVDTENPEVSLAKIQEELNVPMDKAVQDGIISSGTVTIDSSADILKDEELNLEVVYVPKGHIRIINATVAVSNPYTA